MAVFYIFKHRQQLHRQETILNIYMLVWENRRLQSGRQVWVLKAKMLCTEGISQDIRFREYAVVKSAPGYLSAVTYFASWSRMKQFTEKAEINVCFFLRDPISFSITCSVLLKCLSNTWCVLSRYTSSRPELLKPYHSTLENLELNSQIYFFTNTQSDPSCFPFGTRDSAVRVYTVLPSISTFWFHL